MQDDPRSVVREAWVEVTSTLGLPVILDAAQVGSLAHRVRAYWTNMIPRKWLESVILMEGRLEKLYVDDILDDC